jgi:hypothetical protein
VVSFAVLHAGGEGSLKSSLRVQLVRNPDRHARAAATSANAYRRNHEGKARTHSRRPSTIPAERASSSERSPRHQAACGASRGYEARRGSRDSWCRATLRSAGALGNARPRAHERRRSRCARRWAPSATRRRGRGGARPKGVCRRRALPEVASAGAIAPPHAELAHHGLELTPCLGELVCRASAVHGACEPTNIHELAEPGREHRPGDTRDAAPDVAEAVAAAEKLAHDKERPSLAEHVERTGYGAELAEGFHTRSIDVAHDLRGTDSVLGPRR